MTLTPQQEARELMIDRLTAVHGLDRAAAAEAVDHVRARRPHPLRSLVTAVAVATVAGELAAALAHTATEAPHA